MKNFINIADISKKDLRKIIDHAKAQKEKRFNLKKSAVDPNIPLEGRVFKTDDEIRALFHLPEQLHIRRDRNGDIDQVTPPHSPTVKQHYV